MAGLLLEGTSDESERGFDHAHLEGRETCEDHGLPIRGLDKALRGPGVAYHDPYLFVCGGLANADRSGFSLLLYLHRSPFASVIFQDFPSPSHFAR